MAVISTWPISHNGKIYPPGMTITFLQAEEEDKLVDDGVATYTDEDSSEHSDAPLTLKEFSDLKADLQKEHLLLLEITPADKAPDRIAQYATWLDADGN